MHGCHLSVREVLCCISYTLSSSKCTFRYTYHVTTCLPFTNSIVLVIWSKKFGESDGRCVHASGPASAERSIFCLLLNPPSDVCFSASFVVPWVRECSPFLSPPFATPRPDVLGTDQFCSLVDPHRVSLRRRYIGGTGARGGEV